MGFGVKYSCCCSKFDLILILSKCFYDNKKKFYRILIRSVLYAKNVAIQSKNIFFFLKFILLIFRNFIFYTRFVLWFLHFFFFSTIFISSQVQLESRCYKRAFKGINRKKVASQKVSVFTFHPLSL